MSTAGRKGNAVTGEKIHKTFTSDKGVATWALDNVSSRFVTARSPRWSARMARGRPRLCV